MRLTYLPHHSVAAEWPALASMLGPVAARQECDLSLDDMRDLLDREHVMALVVTDDAGAAVATGLIQIRDYERDGRREMWILTLAGRRCGDWRDVIERVEVMARAERCSRVCFVGRAAWRRVLPDYTAEPCERGTFFHKPLTEH